MSSATRYQQYAAECVRQAQSERSPDHKTIMLNVALAWLRLARQVDLDRQDDAPPTAPSAVRPELIS